MLVFKVEGLVFFSFILGSLIFRRIVSLVWIVIFSIEFWVTYLYTFSFRGVRSGWIFSTVFAFSLNSIVYYG